MKLSDEIRDWCNDAYSGRKIRTTKDLYAIADRIDNEMMELPKDRDGVPIHIGDGVYDSFGNQGNVSSFSVNICTTDIFVDGNISHEHSPMCYTHTRPDSFERIADELEEWSEDNRVNGDGEIFDRAADFAERIRKLAKKEG